LVFKVSDLLFSQVSTLQTETDKRCWRWNLQLLFGSPLRDLFFDPFWVFIHALPTTGLDELTNRCVMLRRQVGLFFKTFSEPW